jgi:hypothetical protein
MIFVLLMSVDVAKLESSSDHRIGQRALYTMYSQVARTCTELL